MIDKNGVWTADNCHSFALYNQGNVNVTVWNVLVLRPGQYFDGPTENPDTIDRSSLDVQFDMINDPAVVQPDTGPQPVARSYFPPAVPVPARDPRLIVIKTFLEPIN
jgi:hypothetical protein